MRLLSTHLTLLALVAALALILAGCGGSFAPTLPSPNGGGGTPPGAHTSAIGGGASLPPTLTAENFKVTIDGTPAAVTKAVHGGSATKVAISFIFDTTGSMSGEIDGVKASIQAFADAFAGKEVTWQGSEYGDSDFANPVVEQNEDTDSTSGAGSTRTKFDPSTDLAGFKAWIGTLTARGGGDTPENPLKTIMDTRKLFPAGTLVNYIVITDTGAHERTDGVKFSDGVIKCAFTGEEVLSALRGSATVYAISPDFTSAWASAGEAGLKSMPSNSKVSPQLYVSGDGFDVRELADGGPPAFRTNSGTGGKWIELPSGGDVDLTTLGIAAAITNSYTITYVVPAGKVSGAVVITASPPGKPPVVFDLGTVTF